MALRIGSGQGGLRGSLSEEATSELQPGRCGGASGGKSWGNHVQGEGHAGKGPGEGGGDQVSGSDAQPPAERAWRVVALQRPQRGERGPRGTTEEKAGTLQARGVPHRKESHCKCLV